MRLPAWLAALCLTGSLLWIAPSPAAGKQARAGWPTFGFDTQRSGFNPAERVLSPHDVGRLKQRWTTRLGSVTNTQPVVAAAVPVRGGVRRDLVLTGSENGRLVAVSARSGRIVWQRELGARRTGCSDLPGGVAGITGTPVIDRTARRVYAVGGTGVLYAVDLLTGAVRRRWTITTKPATEHVWGGLNLFRGRVFVTVAGMCDFPPYHGRIVSIDVAGRARATWFVTGRNGTDGGGIWGWGGASIDAAGTVYAGTGNALGAGAAEHSQYAEHLVALDARLNVRASNSPGVSDFDADFGATPLVFRVPRCPAKIAIENKYGTLYLYDRDRIGSGPVQRLAVADPSNGAYGEVALLGLPAYSPVTRLLYVATPSNRGSYRQGMLAFRMTSRCRLSLAWQAPVDFPRSTTSTPTVAGGLVFYGNGVGNRIIAFDAKTGRRIWSSADTITGAVFAATTVYGGRVYAGSWDGRLHSYALDATPAH
jgi:outer membrane protein assembly factor BamB